MGGLFGAHFAEELERCSSAFLSEGSGVDTVAVLDGEVLSWPRLPLLVREWDRDPRRRFPGMLPSLSLLKVDIAPEALVRLSRLFSNACWARAARFARKFAEFARPVGLAGGGDGDEWYVYSLTERIWTALETDGAERDPN